MILIVIALTFLLSVGIGIYENYKTRQAIKTLWDRKRALSDNNNPYVHYHNYFVNIMENEDTEDRNIVDDQTWSDLDVGQLLPKSNFTFTTIGDELLYASLRNATESSIIDEDLIDKITEDREFRERISYQLAKLGKSRNSDTSKFMYAFRPRMEYNPLFILLSLLPIIGVFMFFIHPLLSIVTVLSGLGANLYISQKHKSSTGFDYPDIFHAINIIIAAGKINSRYNRKGLKRLSFISPLSVTDDNAGEMNIGLQLFIGLKSAFLLDYHLYHLVIRSLSRNHTLYGESWRYLAEMDVNYSVALWRETLPYFTTPEVAETSSIQTEGLYHPLLTEPVENDLDYDTDILLTGSNAAGKSTFMKALGLNVIMSNGLNTSTSTMFKYRRGKVISSMDITDSVIEGDSYFISEIKSLKRIMEEVEDFEGNVYCIIDEIFKGTNTIERVAAAETVLRYLNRRGNVFVIAATHDMELTDLLKDKYVFYHFREHLEGDDIYFDYKLRKGVASTSNAIELLRLYEFPDEVYEEAKRKIE
ncbi:hypothetical protein ACFOLA_07015 [Salinicoccus hispanicus]|uniref:DNA mismatch repair proteins mutS family domain-containing protein n=1 Tax=Salinicoccus hispanicus TaxID=157225 RepID=A0A6N8U2F2_9STAP|nr:hypothetical protein [Salinicoccus hispanicus]MXQ51517.1 hypothetical protein [Salinicoccus hispanicus]